MLLTFWILLAVGVGLFTLSLLFLFPSLADKISPSKKGGVVKIKDTRISVEVADNMLTLARGLSGRMFLNPDHGMLFVFRKPKKPLFWMQGMRFPIDIIWITDGSVIAVHEDASSELSPVKPQIYAPPEPVTHVLEVNAGFVARYKIKVGDRVVFPD